MTNMSAGTAEVREWLSESVRRTHEMSPELWSLDAGERARVAQVFLHLRSLTPASWDVDCEYNRQGLHGSPKMWTSNDQERYGTPDIVIHRRGLGGSENNLLVVEFKNTTESLHADSDDSRKVEHWIRTFKYQNGAVVGFGQTRTSFHPLVLWKSEDHTSAEPEAL